MNYADQDNNWLGRGLTVNCAQLSDIKQERVVSKFMAEANDGENDKNFHW
jgi:hypothetical protein